MNYYKRHLGDYARDTGHLTALEHGIYCLLLDYYYSTEKPIPKDKAHRIARANPEQTQTVCEEFFKSDGDAWRHGYADRQIAEYNAKAEINRSNGTKGGRKPSQNEPKANPNGTQSVNSGNLSHKPLAISHKKDKKIDADASVFDPREALASMQVPSDVIADFLKVRAAKKAPLTQTAIDGIKREAEKAGVTFAQAVRTAVERGWQGFKADWVKDSAPVNKSNNSEPPTNYWKAGEL